MYHLHFRLQRMSEGTIPEGQRKEATLLVSLNGFRKVQRTERAILEAVDKIDVGSGFVS